MNWKRKVYNKSLQVILFEIDCSLFYTNLLELFRQFISWTTWVNSGKFMENHWISCQVMADMKKVYDDLIIINLYMFYDNHHSILIPALGGHSVCTVAVKTDRKWIWKHYELAILRPFLAIFPPTTLIAFTKLRFWQSFWSA